MKKRPVAFRLNKINIYSHIMYHARIAQLFANERHLVDMILTSSTKAPDVIKGSSIGIMWYLSFSNIKEASQIITDTIIEKWPFQQLQRKTTLTRMLMQCRDEEYSVPIVDGSIRVHLSRVRYDTAPTNTTTMER